MTRQSRPAPKAALACAGLLVVLLAWAIASQPPPVVADFAFQSPPDANAAAATATPIQNSAFQSPPPVQTPASTPTESVPTPAQEPAAPQGQEPKEAPPEATQLPREEQPLPLEPLEPAQQSDLEILFRTLALAFGYLWLGCGIIILIAIPVILFWLDRRGRRAHS